MMPVEFPVVLGRDFAGTVEALGEGVTDFAELRRSLHQVFFFIARAIDTPTTTRVISR